MKHWTIIPPPGWLAAVLGAAITVIGLQPGNLDLPIDEEASGLGSTAGPKGEGPSLPPLSDLDAAMQTFVARPLLAEGRRPFAPAPVEAEPVATPEPIPQPVDPITEVVPEPPTIELLGTIERSEDRRALIRDQDSDLEIWVAVGESIGGWEIAGIQPDSMSLKWRDAEITLYLFRNALP